MWRREAYVAVARVAHARELLGGCGDVLFWSIDRGGGKIRLDRCPDGGLRCGTMLSV